MLPEVWYLKKNKRLVNLASTNLEFEFELTRVKTLNKDMDMFGHARICLCHRRCKIFDSICNQKIEFSVNHRGRHQSVFITFSPLVASTIQLNQSNGVFIIRGEFHIAKIEFSTNRAKKTKSVFIDLKTLSL